MAIKSRAVTVTTTATRLDSEAETGDSNSASSMSVYNNSSVTVFIGGSDVSVANGTAVPAAAHYAIDAQTNEGLYGIVASGTADVRVLEQGV